MTNLTEQWKKGKLPVGEYYIRYPFGETTTGVFDGKYWEFLFDNDEVKNVLAPVPTYEEWQAKLEENAKLKTKNKELCKKIDELYENIDMWAKENAKLEEEVSRESYKVSEAYCYVEELKELLKDCKGLFDECFSPSVKKGELYRKIDEVLK